MRIDALITRNPEKNYGRAEWGLAGALLATDYKSPPIVMEFYED